MYDPPRPGLEPVSPALAGGFLTTVPPGKSQLSLFLSTFICLKITVKKTEKDRQMEEGKEEKKNEKGKETKRERIKKRNARMSWCKNF